MLFCLAGILLEHVQAHPPSRLLIDHPAPAAAPELPSQEEHKHQDPSKQHSRKYGVGSAIGGLLGALRAADTDTVGSKEVAAQVKVGKELCPWEASALYRRSICGCHYLHAKFKPVMYQTQTKGITHCIHVQ